MHRLYIHVPFCQQKCDYCAFYSEANPNSEQITRYFERIEQEFAEQSSKCEELKSIYIGGGTPSLLSCEHLSLLFELISANFAISKDAEISMECNPESLSEAKILIISKFANRISLGIQSFNQLFRQNIGRSGSIGNISKWIEFLTANGIKNIGCDLIYAIPGERLAEWEVELQQMLSFPIKHISAYSLTYEEGTKLYGGEGAIDNDEHQETEIAMWEFAGKFLASRGFERYEVSNYAIPGYECQHNNGIWFGDTYLGCGPAASSFDGFDRWTNPASLEKWLNGGKAELDQIPSENRAKEIFAMGLRTTRGWEFDKFKSKTGYECQTWLGDLKEIIDNNLLVVEKNRIFCSQRGLLLWNEIAECLF